MLKSYLYTTAKWTGTIIATGGIVLLRIFIGSLLIREYVYSEIDWRCFMICIALTIVAVFAAYRLMKAKWYVRSFGNAIFHLYAVYCKSLPYLAFSAASINFFAAVVDVFAYINPYGIENSDTKGMVIKLVCISL